MAHTKRKKDRKSNSGPASASADRPGIHFFGDPHGDFEPVLDAVQRLQPEAIVLLGDLQVRQPFKVLLQHTGSNQSGTVVRREGPRIRLGCEAVEGLRRLTACNGRITAMRVVRS